MLQQKKKPHQFQCVVCVVSLVRLRGAVDANQPGIVRQNARNLTGSIIKCIAVQLPTW